jgi:hypothetical protein
MPAQLEELSILAPVSEVRGGFTLRIVRVPECESEW